MLICGSSFDNSPKVKRCMVLEASPLLLLLLLLNSTIYIDYAKHSFRGLQDKAVEKKSHFQLLVLSRQRQSGMKFEHFIAFLENLIQLHQQMHNVQFRFQGVKNILKIPSCLSSSRATYLAAGGRGFKHLNFAFVVTPCV